MTTVSGALSTVPSFTMSDTMYWPGRSTTNEGVTDRRFESRAALSAGAGTNGQVQRRRSPSTSVDALPSRRTRVPTTALRSGPALATGTLFGTSITTESVAGAWPSLTISRATYVPGRSTTNVARALV